MNFLKKCLFVSALLAGICQLQAYEKLDWNNKSLQAGKANLVTNGYRVSRPLGTANFSPEFAMTVQLIYDSAQNKRGIFGDVWNSPQLESRVFPREFGAEWVSPWGERVPFYQKQGIDKEAPEVYKEKMKGAGCFSPYSEWEAKGSKGNWTITGLHKKEGWTFEYSDSLLRKVSAPSGRSISFNYKNKKLEKVSQDGTAFIELAYDKGEKTVSGIKINGVSCAFTYGSVNSVTLPEKLGQQKTSEERVMLTSIQAEDVAAQKFSYDDCGYMNKFEVASFIDEMTVEHETLEERLAFLTKIDEAKKAKKSTVNMVPEKVSGRILQDKFYTYAYPEKDSVSITNVAGETALYNYSDLKGVLKVRDFAGLEQQIFYFRRFDVAYNGKFRQILDAKDRAVMNCRYDKKTGELIRVRDMADNEIYYEYDKSRNLVKVSRTEENPDSPIRPLMAFKYDKSGNMTASEKLDRAGKAVWVTKFKYDKSNDVTEVETPESRFKIDYNEFGYVKKVTDTFGRTLQVAYDSYNRQISKTQPNGVKTVYDFAKKSNRLDSMSSFAPDLKEALSSLNFKYDDVGRVEAVTDNRGRTKKFDRDEFGRVIEEIFADNSKVGYAYNQLGKLVKVTDQNENPIEFEYNKFGKVSQRFNAANQYTENEYDKYGLLKRSVKKGASSSEIARDMKYSHDEFDRVVRIDYDNGNVKTLEYDSYGKILVVRTLENGKPSYENTLAYDEFDRVSRKVISRLKVDGSKDETVYDYTYTVSGRTKTVSIVFPDKTKTLTINEYDKNGRLVSITEGNKKIAYKYDEKSRLSEQVINGIPVVYAYTSLWRLAGKTMGSLSAPIASVKYFYSNDGQIIAREINGKRQEYKYDLKGQLIASEGDKPEHYEYDPAGNILKKQIGSQVTSFAYDKANQLVKSVTNGLETYYDYDFAGRLAKESSKEVTREYSYAWLDKVVQTNTNGDRRSFSYYPDGQLAEAVGAGKSEEFYWNRLALVRRDNTLYMNEPSVTGGNPVIADNKVFFNDVLGNSIGTKDGETFNLISRDSFGGGNQDGFFTGKPYVEGLGYAFLFRNYRPELGKWQTADPLGYPDGWNNFAYCKNGVTNYIDFLGAWSVPAHNAIIAEQFSDLSYTDMAAIQAGSEYVDRLANQGSDAAYQHSMRSPDQSPGEALAARDAFIDDCLTQANNLINTDRNAALELMGQAMHAIEDSFCPLHVDEDGYPKDWSPYDPIGVVGHMLGDEGPEDVTPEIMDNIKKRTSDYLERYPKLKQGLAE